MTKEQLKEAFEQGSDIQLKHTTVKIIHIIDSIYIVSCNSSDSLKLWRIDKFKDANVIQSTKNQGFEIGNNYKDVVWVSNDAYAWHLRILEEVKEDRFIDIDGWKWNFAKRPTKDEFNVVFAE